MESNNPTRRSLLGAIGGSIVLAGCTGDDDGDNGGNGDDNGGGNGDANGDDDTGNGGNGDADAPTVAVASHDEYGDILVGPDGLTLYMFDQDEQGTGGSSCSGGCAESWPPLTVEDEPVAGDGVGAELTTFERGDGSTQVAANGWPLYYWAGDEEPGDTNGQGVNDVWWVLDPDGSPIRGGGGGGGNGSGGGGGNGGDDGGDDDGGGGGAY